MNEKLNLVEILKDCPRGTKLYSTVYGDVEFYKIDLDSDSTLKIYVKIWAGVIVRFDDSGKLELSCRGECTLFPSRMQRNWAEFKPKKPKFDPQTLQAFDKVLVKMGNESYNTWYADFIAEPAHAKNETPLILGAKEANMVIPYNDDTKHLVGTSDEAPEYYRYWED